MDNLSGRRYLCVHCWRVYVGEVPIVCACGENHYCSCSECQQLIDALLAGALGRDERLKIPDWWYLISWTAEGGAKINKIKMAVVGMDYQLSRGNNRSHSKSGAVQLSLF